MRKALVDVSNESFADEAEYSAAKVDAVNENGLLQMHFLPAQLPQLFIQGKSTTVRDLIC
ncbi:MAG: hypothetical protein KA226_13800 [Gemmatimonadales bacterium]|nr:hypothetical protein [Gemmatimonadales bacterium]